MISANTNKVLVASSITFILLSFIWIFKVYVKYIKPLKKMEKILENGKNKDFEEIRKIIQESELGYPFSLVSQISTIISEDSTKKMLTTQATLFALQSQINPHFLYNTLETIRSYALNVNEENIADMTEALATLFRYSISRPDEIATLADEIDNVKNYIKIQKYRFPDCFDVEWSLEDANDPEVMGTGMPILILQPLVENAFHHGIEKKMSKGTIWVRIFATEKKIVIQIEDNGEGIEEKTLLHIREMLKKPMDYFGDISVRQNRRNGGIALGNVNQRLKLFYGGDYGINMTSTVGVGTMAEIVIPRNKYRVKKGV